MNTKRGTKRIFYDCIVCITHPGIKFRGGSCTYVHMLSASLQKRMYFNTIPGLGMQLLALDTGSHHTTLRSGVKEHVQLMGQQILPRYWYLLSLFQGFLF